MRKNLYAIRDNVAESIIGGVHVHVHHAPAIRMFSDIAASEGTQIAQHLEDFDLLCIGAFDESTGNLSPDHMDVEIVLKGSVLRDTWAAQKAATNGNEG